MSWDIFIRYLHFISIFMVVSSLVAEHLLLKPELTRGEIKRLSVIDGIYGMGALLVLGAGLLLWFVVGKPSAFYTHNYLFHTKITLYILLGLLSIGPTIFFLKNRKGDPNESVKLPSKIKWFIRIELLLIFIIPLLASLMAKGVGYYK